MNSPSNQLIGDSLNADENIPQILSPEGELAPSDFATYYRWVNYLERQHCQDDNPLITAAFGKPTAPVDPDLLDAMRHYWQFFPEGAAIPYCDTAGLWNCRILMAKALEMQYGNKIKIDPEHLAFTIGGCGALQAAFFAIHQHNPKGKLAAIMPFYPQYKVLYGGAAHNRLHPIDVTRTGYRLTAQALNP